MMKWAQITQDYSCTRKCIGYHVVITWPGSQVFELCEEIIFFLNQQKNISLAERFTQKKFVANIAYMSDIFHSLNCLNESVQGPGFTVLDHSAKITAYYKKLSLWQTYIKRDEFDMSPDLKKYLIGKEVNIKNTIIEHFEKLTKKLSNIMVIL